MGGGGGSEEFGGRLLPYPVAAGGRPFDDLITGELTVNLLDGTS